MAIFFDVLLVALLLFTIIRHAVLGLTCSILMAGRFFASLILAGVLCYPVAALLHFLGIPSALSGILAFIAIFICAMLLSKMLISLLSKIKIPLVTKIDKTLGLVLGIVLGLILTSLLATVIYTVLEVSAVVGGQPDAMAPFNNSYVFRFIYNLRIFEFIRNFF